MQLTKQTDFAFRVLIYLAENYQDDSLSQIQHIAQRYDISKNHLMKVVQKLSNHGYITAKRGHQGGLRLGKPAQQITLKEIVVLIEQTLDPANCDQPSCILKSDCRLKMHLLKAQEHFLSYLASVTIADLLTSSTHEILFHPNPNLTHAQTPHQLP